MKETIFNKLLNKAFFYLKFRPRTSFEVKQYLLKKKDKIKGATFNDIDKVIEHLQTIGLVDDNQFIDWLVSQRNTNKPKSVFALKQELKRFGLEKQIIENYFLNHNLDEKELAFKVLKKRWPRLEFLSIKERKQKATQFLLRRGFSFEIIKEAIDKLEKKE